MLVVSRKEGQRILIGDDIVVVINRIRGSVVSVGIDAPESVAIRRQELLAKESTSDKEQES